MTTLALKPNRRWPPRFSLITLLVAVNVAGVLVWANLRNRLAGWIIQFPWDNVAYGWPIRWYASYTVDPRGRFGFHSREIGSVILDVLICVNLVVVSAILTEFLVRKFYKAERHDE